MLTDRRNDSALIAARRVAQILIGVVTAALVTSIGGLAIFASPILLPANWWACWRSRTSAARLVFAALGGAVAAEVVWWLLYVAGVRFHPPAWRLLAAMVGTMVVVAYLYLVTTRRVGGPGRRQETPHAA